MIIYNTTFSVENALDEQFLDFIGKEYIPRALKNNMISEPRLSRIHSVDEKAGLAYALEFKVANIEILEAWNIQTGKELYILLMSKFQQKVLGFSTILQPIEL